MSFVTLANAWGRSGGGQARGAHPSGPVGARAADAGCVPSGQEKSPFMHCDGAKAPGEVVVEPAAQKLHAEREADPIPSLKRPSGQSMGAEAPVAGEYVPAGASVHEAAPGREKVLAAQAMQVEGVTAPNTALKVPAGQLAQEAEVCPGAGLYVPARQGVQLRAVVPPAKSRVVPAGQGVQRAEPGEEEKEPGEQPPQSSKVAAPLKGLSVPGGQGRQEVTLFAPAEGPKRPGGQGSQKVAPK